ncbi:hypothetical protein ACFULT_21900 [Rhodococcus sp. NPDC057297]|uniref:hypothetical protein n=1 Tax=Rhodococcus sp. NPDC057297 TaxID=3346090 RepID=UPI00362C8692
MRIRTLTGPPLTSEAVRGTLTAIVLTTDTDSDDRTDTAPGRRHLLENTGTPQITRRAS